MSQPSLRLFFALPCMAPLRHAIDGWRQHLAIDGVPVASANLHLTLAFIGTTPESRLPALLELGASLHGQAFDLHLNHLACWRNGILHLAPTQVAPALLRLVERLEQGLTELEIEREARPYCPHVTLARHCRHAPNASGVDFHLEAPALTLYRSDTGADGVRYSALGTWPLESA